MDPPFSSFLEFEKLHWETKGGFVKGWFWRTCPRSGFRSGGTYECTLVLAFVPEEHANVPLFRFLFWGNIRRNHPFVTPIGDRFGYLLLFFGFGGGKGRRSPRQKGGCAFYMEIGKGFRFAERGGPKYIVRVRNSHQANL